MPTLRTILKLDSAVTGANGAAYLVLGGPIGDLLGLPAAELRVAGAFLLLFAAGVWWVATRESVSPAAVLAIIAANVLWVLDSLVLLATDWSDPTATGAVWIALQAATVALFAALQAAGRAHAPS